MESHNIIVFVLYPSDFQKFKLFCEKLKRGDTVVEPKKLTSDGLLFHYATAKTRSDETYRELKLLEEEIKRRIPLMKDQYQAGNLKMEGDIIE